MLVNCSFSSVFIFCQLIHVICKKAILGTTFYLHGTVLVADQTISRCDVETNATFSNLT